MDETALATHSDTQPWHLPLKGLALFEGDRDVGLLSQYFLPSLVLERRSVLILDGANSSNPRLMARLAVRRRIPFCEFSRRVLIARAFTCFQMTELIARVPKFQSEYGVDVLLVTALPELYLDEDITNSDARASLACALDGIGRVTRQGNPPLAAGVFSSTARFGTPRARRNFPEMVRAIATELWRFEPYGEGKTEPSLRRVGQQGTTLAVAGRKLVDSHYSAG